MKIIISESQYKRLLSEEYEDKINEFKKIIYGGGFKHPDILLDEYFNIFDYDKDNAISAIENDDELYNIFLEKLLSGYFYHTYVNEKIYLTNIFNYVIEKYSIFLFKDRKNILKNFNILLNIKFKLPFWYENDLLNEFVDALFNDVTKLIFNKYPPKEAIKELSILTDKLGNRYKVRLFDVVKKYAEDNGLLLILKDKGLTFNRREDSMVRDVINYLKDPSEKIKTKTGFLRYIGSSLGGGQHATFWSALNKSGIIQKIGSGNNVTYTFGPNYDEWENGNLIAF